MNEDLKERLAADAALQAEILAKLPKSKASSWLRKEITKRGKLSSEALATITTLRAEVARKDEALRRIKTGATDYLAYETPMRGHVEGIERIALAALSPEPEAAPQPPARGEDR